ncbi:MAG: hypothetical protein ABSC23_00245 [Bryobacteraceae bacterium]|jgi:hypothetical protein
MQTLFWKAANATRSLLPTPFKSEEEFEKAVFDTPEILEEIFLLKRQVRGGNKSGIPDIIGLDKEGNVCIVEMKNVTVDASIVPQVLQYAIWAETNPDSVKALWLECKKKPDDITVSWEDFDVRVVVIAPIILRSTLEIVKRINYPVDLIEVNRWVDGDNHLLLVNRLEPDDKGRPKPVAGLDVYDLAHYEAHFNAESAKEFFRYIKELEEIVAKEKWSLEKKVNKTYCGFKAGFFNVFGIQFVGSKTFAFFIKLPEAEAKSNVPVPTRYESQWKQGLYVIDPKTTKTMEFLPILRAAYERQTGKTY